MKNDRPRRTVQAALGLAFALFSILAAAGLLGLDKGVSDWAATLPQGKTWWGEGTTSLDIVSTKKISNFLLGALLLLAAGAARMAKGFRHLAGPVLYLGAVQALTTLITDLSKPPFGRLRPYQSLADAGGADVWFVGANSFPSGHAGFYAGLFFPLMMLFPRAAPLFAIPPLFIASARVAEHDHYLSDVSVSLALAALLAVLFAFILRRGSGVPR